LGGFQAAKELMKSAFDLYQNISKYMKFMAFVKSASPLTLRAYWLDLQQAFKIPKESITPHWGPQTAGQFVAEGEPFSASGPVWTEEELLDRARGAFQIWGKLGLASRNRKAATLKSFLGWAYSECLLERDLSERIICPRVPQKMPHFLSVDEVVALLESFKAEELTSQNLREQVLMLLLYGGGLRVSEACQVSWSRIDFDRRLIRVMGKGSKERLVPLPAPSMNALKKLKTSSENEFVFGPEVLNPRTAYDWVRRRGEKAGLLQQLHPHALRHSYATHLLSGGANLRTLQELLGHESLRATEKYTHLGIDQLARTMEKSHPLGEKKTRTGS
jgi:integrase/recombinase XerC/integrase/recombinase XerD